MIPSLRNSDTAPSTLKLILLGILSTLADFIGMAAIFGALYGISLILHGLGE